MPGLLTTAPGFSFEDSAGTAAPAAASRAFGKPGGFSPSDRPSLPAVSPSAFSFSLSGKFIYNSPHRLRRTAAAGERARNLPIYSDAEYRARRIHLLSVKGKHEN